MVPLYLHTYYYYYYNFYYHHHHDNNNNNYYYYYDKPSYNPSRTPCTANDNTPTRLKVTYCTAPKGPKS